jgi:hypothetical protein
MLRKLRKLPYKGSSQGGVLHEGEAELAPPRPTLSFTKQPLKVLLAEYAGCLIPCPEGSQGRGASGLLGSGFRPASLTEFGRIEAGGYYHPGLRSR